MRTSQNGIDYIKKHEKLVLFVYDDFAPKNPHTAGTPVQGTLTAGWGHTGPDVYSGMEVTEAMANAWLQADLGWAENRVNQKITERGLSQNQFDMLVSHTFNSGGSDTLFQRVNDYLRGLIPIEQVGAWWTSTYITSKGRTLQGLITRRAEEFEIFEDGYNMYEVKKNSPTS